MRSRHARSGATRPLPTRAGQAGGASYAARRAGCLAGWAAWAATLLCFPTGDRLLAQETAPGAAAAREQTAVFLVPNFHDACMGWLVDYAEERNYGLYCYLAHLDRVAADPQYRFVMSEIPHLITMMEFEPARLEELKRRIAEGRVELGNAFVLEPTVSLSGGEALVQQGVQGLRWYRDALGVRPRSAWMIDLCGWHEQMAQIAAGLGLEAFVYCRYNPTGKEPTGEPKLINWDEVKSGSALHWIASPDGSKVLAVSPGLYCDVDLQPLFRSERALADDELAKLVKIAQANRQRFPAGVPTVVFGGEWDYSLPFRYRGYPAELLRAWNRLAPQAPLRISTFAEYLDAALPAVRRQAAALPSASTSSKYGWPAFWVNAPKIKQRYRRTEHRLQTAEALATIGSLSAGAAYPSQELANAWFLMALNMDRNVLWGAGVDASFSDPRSWDVCDRFDYVEAKSDGAVERALGALAGKEARSIVLYNPVNWTRRDPVELRLPPGKTLVGATSQALEDGATQSIDLALAPMSLASAKLGQAQPAPAAATDWPGVIGTKHYEAKLDPATGALVSLKLRPSGREVLGGPANEVVAEAKSDVHNLPEKAKRTPLARSSQFKPQVRVASGPLATIVEIRGGFHGGGPLRRVVRFYHNSPRIDFVTEVYDIPAGTVLSVEFPLRDPITELRRGIPYGFAHGAVAKKDPRLTGLTSGILPAIRYSDYASAGGGVAILDRGVPGRELVGNTAILLLHNVCDAYALSWKINDKLFSQPSVWMNAKGKQSFEYALYAHEASWSEAGVAQMAWEYNSPVAVAPGLAVAQAASFCETSPNVIVEALRRDGDRIEIRLVECLGQAGEAWVRVNLPHDGAFRTDLLGGRQQPFAGGPRYTLNVRPQEIVTLRLRTARAVSTPAPLRSFDSVIPEGKREFMRSYKNPQRVGHPPP